ncbi:MAG: S1 RNA-binding domain-containing protein, partial [Gammaproteobacteria bacterium]|nr:S1 RNA-binding domain-containing protein [Gammaproteobacteria bacterium]
FTSPIRRYADLLLHRAIRARLRQQRVATLMQGERLTEVGKHVSMTERRADEATRDALSWLKCEFMLDKVGRTYRGTVSAVTSFGLFVTLDELYVDGLVHVSSLGQEYFHFDPASHTLEGRGSGRRYALADRLDVRVLRVDLDERKIDFELTGEEAASGTGKRSRGRSNDEREQRRRRSGSGRGRRNR